MLLLENIIRKIGPNNVISHRTTCLDFRFEKYEKSIAH